MAAPPAGVLAEDDEASLTDLLRILQRRWMVALPVFLAALGASAARYTQVVPQYETMTSIRLDKKQQQLAGITPMGMLDERRGLGTEMQVLKSRAVAREVVARTAYAVRVVSPRLHRTALLDSIALPNSALPGQYQLAGSSNGTITATAPDASTATGRAGEWMTIGGMRLFPSPLAAQTGEVVLNVQAEQDAVTRFMNTLKVAQPARDAEVLRITIRDPDPRLAARLTDAVAEVFTNSQANRRQSGGRSTVEFIRGQLDTLDRQLLEAETALRDWRAQQKVVVPTAEAGAAVERRSEYEARIAEKKLELESVEGLLRGTSRGNTSESAQLKGGFRRVLSAPAMRQNQAASNILTTLLQLESQRAELRGRRTAADPDVQVLEKTIADYELQGQLFVGTYLDALRAEISGYERTLARLGTTLQALPGQELTLATLQRNTEVLSALQATLRTRLKEAEITNAGQDATVEVLDRAELPSRPVAPVLTVYLAVGVAAGGLLALLAALGIDKMDRTIHSREDIENATRAPLVGLIPTFTPTKGPLPALGKGAKGKGAAAIRLGDGTAKGTAKSSSKSTALVAANGKTIVPVGDTSDVIAITAPRHVAAEAYRMLRTNLRFAPPDRPNRVLSVSSPSPGDGKSTTVVNFAATVAVQGKTVLIVDGDMRKGTLHSKLGIPRTPGLSGVLSGRLPAAEAVRTVQLAEGVLLDVIAAGEVPPNPTELLGGSAMAELVAWGREHYDQVIIDTPPVNMFADGMLIAAASDSMLLVGRAGKSFRDEMQVAGEQLRSLNVRVAGVVLNDFDARRDGRFGGYYYYERYQYKYYAAYQDDAEQDAEQEKEPA
jgi:capsular exopolysaccharide synthesis family protein